MKVMFVCTGNICRSPTAEALLRHHAQVRGLEIEVASSGTHGYHIGELPDPRTMQVALERGVDMSAQRAQKFHPKHYDEYDYIFAMDRGHYDQLMHKAPDAAKAKIHLFLEHSGKNGDVPDPYYGTMSGFEQVYDMLDEAVREFLDEKQ